MRINIQFSSAIHVLLMIALLSDRYKVTSEFIASSVGSNPVEIRKLLSSLRKADIIEVARGSGGAKLKKMPKDITLLDIYSAVDSTSLDELIGLHAHPEQRCPFGRNIYNILAEPYAEIGEAVRQKMSSITLELLCSKLKGIEPTINTVSPETKSKKTAHSDMG